MRATFDWKNGIVAIIGRQEGQPAPVGSGFVVSDDGLIATCAHVLDQAGWPFESWDTLVEIRFSATGRGAWAQVLESCFSSQVEDDLALLVLEKPLPDEVEVLPLAAARHVVGHQVKTWGYPLYAPQGLAGHGQVIELLPRGDRAEIQIDSSNTDRGYSGGPVWVPSWGRVAGMILKAPTPPPGGLGRNRYTNYAAMAEDIVRLSGGRLSLIPPVSPIFEETSHIRSAAETLVDDYTRRPFVGRDETLESLDNWLEKEAGGRLILTALAGFGKTALLARWLRHRQAQGDTVAYHFFSDRYEALRSKGDAYANLLSQLASHHHRYDETLPLKGAPRRSRLFNLVQDHERQKDGRLIILLDGLDEAEGPFQLNLPHPLPAGVFLVASARAGDQARGAERPSYLAGWTDNAALKHLDRLPEAALKSWLAEAGDGALAAQSDDPDFVRRLSDITGGYPLYLNYLIDDLVAAEKGGRDLDEILDETPQDFSVYVDDQKTKIAAARGDRKVSDLFILLAVARYPLTVDELLELTDLDEFDLDTLPAGVTRWLNISPGLNDKITYAPAHAHLAGEFEALWPRAAAQMRQRLLDWCAGWPDHASAYALRHYADLLYRARGRPDLFTLAQDDTYANSQQAQLPAEPDLPLRTVRLALQAAAEQERADLMAEFLLLHARRLVALRQVSPLKALRQYLAGRADLHRSWRLADNHDSEARIAWFLLLAWVLAEHGRQAEARATLVHLRRGRLRNIMDGPEGQLALWLLAQLAGSAPEVVLDLINRVAVTKRRDAIDALVRTRHYQMARQIALEIGEQKEKVQALRSVAAAQVQAGLKEAAAETLAMAMEATKGMADEWDKAFALGEIAALQAGAGLKAVAQQTFALALAAAKDNDLELSRALVLDSIAAAQAQAGDVVGALATLEDIDDVSLQGHALASIAAAQAEAGDIEGALATLEDVDDDLNILYEWGVIVTAQAQAGDFEGALTAAESLDPEWTKDLALASIAAAQGQAGDIDGALVTAESITQAWSKAGALRSIGAAQAQAGLAGAGEETFARALSVTEGIEHELDKVKSLTSIGTAQAQAGLEEAAQRTFAMALATAEGIADDKDRAGALMSVGADQAQIGLGAAAEETFAMILAATSGEDHGKLKAEALASIATVQARVGDASGAFVTAEGIVHGRLKAETLAAIAAAQAQNSDITRALATAEDIADRRAQAQALVSIAAAQAGGGDFDGALVTAERVDLEWAKDQALASIAVAQAQAGDLDRALTNVEGIVEEGTRAQALVSIAAVQTQTGDFDGALATAEGISVKRFKAQALTSLGTAQAQAGLGEAAERTFTAAMTLAKSIRGTKFKSLALASLGAAQAQAGLEEAAQQSFALALEKAEYISRGWKKVEALVSLATAQIQVGLKEAAQQNFRKALAATEGITQTSSRASALITITVAQAQAGHINEALMTANGIADEWYRARVLGSITTSLAEAGQGFQAVQVAAQIMSDQSRWLPQVALALAAIKDKRAFAEMLLLSVSAPETALPICAAMVHLYPEQAAEVAKVVIASN